MVDKAVFYMYVGLPLPIIIASTPIFLIYNQGLVHKAHLLPMYQGNLGNSNLMMVFENLISGFVYPFM
jgi:MoaA/NifB/PqqE/SkfB family radical SAM enzyme